jgi:hypothetical protein
MTVPDFLIMQRPPIGVEDALVHHLEHRLHELGLGRLELARHRIALDQL